MKIIGWLLGWVIFSLFWGTVAWFVDRLFYGDWEYFNTIRLWFGIAPLAYILIKICTAPSPRYRSSQNIGPFIGPF